MAIAEQYPRALSIPDRATQPQINFICDLMDKKNLFAMPDWFDKVNAMDEGEYAQHIAYIKSMLPNITRAKASAMIEKLKVLPNAAATTEQASAPSTDKWAPHHVVDTHGTHWFMTNRDGDTVPRGSFALRTQDGATNEIAFYSVWINEDGSRWTVRRYQSDELVKLPRSQQYGILARIAENPEAAAALYGHEIGKCGICHRKLTNDVSRARGIGPICAERWGW